MQKKTNTLNLDLKKLSESCKTLVQNGKFVFLNSIKILGVILSTIIENPKQNVYRKIYSQGYSFKPIKIAIGALDFLEAIQFIEEEEEGHLVCPPIIGIDKLQIAFSQLEFTLKQFQKINNCWICPTYKCKEMIDESISECKDCKSPKAPLTLKILIREYNDLEEKEKIMVCFNLFVPFFKTSYLINLQKGKL